MQDNALMMYLYNNGSPDEFLVKLLYAAGELVDWPQLEEWVWDPSMGTVIPEWFQGVEVMGRREQCTSLQDLCRVSIRAQLLSSDRHSNLFIRVPRLGLPSLLTRYLLYHMTLDAPYTAG